MERAYRNFFEGRANFPKFKKKGRERDSYTTNLVTGKASRKIGKPSRNIRMQEKGIILPKFGKVKAVIHRCASVDWKLKSVTVSREKEGTYYASILFEYGMSIEPLKKISSYIGLDYKSNGLYVDSNGVCADMPRYFRKSEKTCPCGATTFQKAERFRKLREAETQGGEDPPPVANKRKDVLEKLSTEIVNRFELISVEDFDLRAISRSLKLGKSTRDNGYVFCYPT